VVVVLEEVREEEEKEKVVMQVVVMQTVVERHLPTQTRTWRKVALNLLRRDSVPRAWSAVHCALQSAQCEQ